MRVLIYLLPFLFNWSFGQLKDTVITVKTPLGIVEVTSQYIMEQEEIRPVYASIGIQLRVNSDVINEAMQKKISADKVILNLIYDDICLLSEFEFKQRSKINEFNKLVTEYFFELQEAFNHNNLGKYLKLFKEQPCGINELEIPVVIR